MLNRKLLAGIATAVMVAFSAPAFADTVAATVDGDKIMKEDVMKALKTLPVKGEDSDKMYPLVLDQVINEKLVDKAVTAAKIEQSDDYKKRLAILQQQLAKQMYVEKFLKDKVSEGKVKAEYEKFREDNKGKQEIHARHIIVPSEEEAKQVIKDLDGGAKFAELAKKRSSGPTSQNGGDLGWFAQDEMLPEFTAAAFKLKPGSYTKEPVKTQFGWHVIMVEDKRSRQVPDLKQVDGAIRNKLGQEALQKMVMDLRAKADIKTFDKSGKPVEAPKKN